MAAKGKSKAAAKPTWVIDTIGLRDALTTSSNSVRNAVIAAIESGEMLILKPVSAELRENYEHLYEELQSFSYKRYLPVRVKDQATAAMLMEMNGSSPLGSIPPADYFEAIAATIGAGCTLVSSGAALERYLNIALGCKLPPCVAPLTAL